MRFPLSQAFLADVHAGAQVPRPRLRRRRVKEIIPVVFSREGVRVALPELEIIESAPPSKVAAV